MSTPDSNYLIEQLLKNKLSGAELDLFLAGLHKPDAIQTYSEVLEALFTELLNQHPYQPEPDKQTK
ncbi:hypothetical protein [Spirosoma pollinicola]|uniref:Uncharacterized protein n=1 Tax=Spirosoma pollinicola TaxID=2057025 RepID=A0A2K8Z565_9BACT|nr:hypothetical protein [Spirosoma pollinicola]AUD05000.1 hypothetical protein CWM47_26015 [Spirosoma pollinicola]